MDATIILYLERIEAYLSFIVLFLSLYVVFKCLSKLFRFIKRKVKLKNVLRVLPTASPRVP